MFFDQLSENKDLEHDKDQGGQQIVYPGPISGVGHQANAKDVEAGCAPYQTGQQQQGISFYFHKLPPLVNIVQFTGYKIPTARWEF